MTWLADLLHRLAHRLDRSTLPCACEFRGMQAGWQRARDRELREAALRGRGEPTSPDELDAAFRRLIADSERDVA